jgi:dsDNA-specific endonuclease/ATPase MutS2
VKLYNDKEEKLLKMAETSEDDDLILKADEIRQTRREVWRKTRDDLLHEADKVMVNRYAEAVVWAKAFKVRTDAVDHAIRRLAFFTDIIGNAKLRDYTQGIVDPNTKQAFTYTDNVFLKTRPGLSPEVPANGMPAPLPVSP